MTNLDSTGVLPHAEDDDEDEAGEPHDDQHLSRHRRRSLLVNGVITVAILVVMALILLTIRGTGSEPTAQTQTSTVDTGEVTATVSANGNVAAGTTVNVDFQGSGGVVTAILVEPGDRVRKGEILARVDQTSARQSVAQARTQLSSAQATYLATVQGLTLQERNRDALTIDQGEVAVASAHTSLQSARDTLGLTKRQQNAAVERAAGTLRRERSDLQEARDAYTADPTPENKQAVDTAAAAVETADAALIQARSTRASAVLQAQQQVDAAADQLRSAQTSLASTRAGVAVNQQGPRDSEIDSAQAQIDAAQVSVDQAMTTLEQTVLRAPVAGKVAQVNGTVGEPSTSSAAASGSASSAASGTTGTTGTTSATSTTDSSGFVVLTGTHALQVTADVAEADIADVEVGQSASITLSASGQEIPGTVTAVDQIETVTNNVVEYGVTVTLGDTNRVKLGQSTQVILTTGTKQGVLRVSSSALTTVGGTTTATVQNSDGTTRVVPVTTGLEGDGYTEVLSGLAEGDTVVLPEQGGLPDGFTFPDVGGLGGLG